MFLYVVLYCCIVLLYCFYREAVVLHAWKEGQAIHVEYPLVGLDFYFSRNSTVIDVSDTRHVLLTVSHRRVNYIVLQITFRF